VKVVSEPDEESGDEEEEESEGDTDPEACCIERVFWSRDGGLCWRGEGDVGDVVSLAKGIEDAVPSCMRLALVSSMGLRR
jgi:hypothetical protein